MNDKTPFRRNNLQLIHDEVHGLGKIPPQNIEVENNILGCLLIENSAYSKVCDIITFESFYKECNQEIFKAIASLYKKNNPIDILTVSSELMSTGRLDVVGGPHYVVGLTREVSGSDNIEYWSYLIQEKYLMRNMIRLCTDTLQKAYDDTSNYFDLLNNVQSELINAVQNTTSNLRHISEVAKDVIELMKLNSKSDKQLSGLPTGLKDLDRASGGLQNGDLIIIAGETSNGKTALALNIAQNCALYGHKIGIFSYEMTDIQLAARHISAASSVSSRRIMFGQMSSDEIGKVIQEITSLLNSEIYIEKTTSASFEKLEIGIRSAVIKNHIELVVIDYLQLIKLVLRGQSKADAVAEIANSLKQLAITLNIPIILLSQLSRDKENSKPSMQRLKGSGDIENAADIIYLVWRPEMYRKDVIDCAGQEFNSKGLAHLIQAKGRNIGTGEFVLRFNPEITLFSDFDVNESVFEPIKPNEQFEYPTNF